MYERQVAPPEHVVPTDLSQPTEFAAISEFEDRSYMTEHSIEDALPDVHHRVEPRLDEPAPEAMQDWDRPVHALGIDPIEMPSAFAPEIRDHHRGDALAAHDDGQGLRVWLIAGALITTFSLGWAGGSNSDRILSLAGDTSASTSPHTLGAEKQTVVAKSDKFASSTPSRVAPDLRKGLPPPASMPESPRKSPAGAARPTAPSPSLVSLIEDSATSLGPATQHETKALTRLMPTPETRPPSIAGWTVRSVDGKTAVLEGPGGVWKAAAGDSVPGVGRVHSIVRWGNHWIVATSKGLITTR